MKIAFISWTRYDRRSELLAQQLGATMHFVYFGQRGKVLQAPVRYLVQAVKTWQQLSAELPDIVFVQNPPITSVFLVSLYCIWHTAWYFIDSHTSAFESPRWGKFLWLHRILSKRAVATIVHNESQEEIVKRWECRYVVLPDPVVGYSEGTDYLLHGEFNVTVVCGFEADEPLESVIEAARRLPEVDFHLTGEFDRADPFVLQDLPDNCHLTGFIPYDRYIGLLRAADAVLDLTTRDHTLLCGAFEAVSLGKPLIVSDWPILREYFSRGTVYVANTATGICKGIREAHQELFSLQHEILQLREELHTRWEVGFRELQLLVDRPWA